MSDPTKELIFQNEVIAEMVAGGWKRGNAVVGSEIETTTAVVTA